MFKIHHLNQTRDKIAARLFGLINRLDNIGLADMHKNGENYFIKNFALANQNTNPIIFDIGANSGEYSENILKNFTGKEISLHLFEPQKSCLGQLEKKFFGDRRVQINNFGLSDKSSTGVLYKDNEGSGLTSLYCRDLNYYKIDLSIKEDISLSRADNYIDSLSIQHLNLVKIDVEGHEMSVLSGFGRYLKPDFIDLIQFEYGGADLDSRTTLQDFYRLFEEKGFSLASIRKNCLELRPYHPRLENFVMRNYVAISNKFCQNQLI